MSHFKEKLISGMVANGYEQDFAERTFSQIEGFGSYGFPESHAASFALIAYASSWVKCHHADVFCCALLNSQPMGFYAPAQVVRDAQEHGIKVRPVCVNASRWDCTLKPAGNGDRLAVRLGLRVATGLNAAHGMQVVAHRATQPYASVEALWRQAGVPAAALERLAEADAFGSLRLGRRQALWAIRGLADQPLPLFDATDRDDAPRPEAEEPGVALVPMPEGCEVVEDYRSTGLSLRAHPVSFLRGELRRQGIATCAELERLHNGRRVTVTGLVLVRQKPGSAKGVMFITLEDETAIANLVVWPTVFERQRRLVLSASMMACQGRVQAQGGVVHLVAERLVDLSELLRGLGQRGSVFPLRHGRGDGAKHPGNPDQREQDRLQDRRTRDSDVQELGPGAGITVPTRDFR